MRCWVGRSAAVCTWVWCCYRRAGDAFWRWGWTASKLIGCYWGCTATTWWARAAVCVVRVADLQVFWFCRRSICCPAIGGYSVRRQYGLIGCGWAVRFGCSSVRWYRLLDAVDGGCVWLWWWIGVLWIWLGMSYSSKRVIILSVRW